MGPSRPGMANREHRQDSRWAGLFFGREGLCCHATGLNYAVHRLPALIAAPLFLFIIFSQPILLFSPDHGACTMMVDEQIQSYRISFELTKPNHSNPALLVPWCWSSTFFVNSGFDPEFVEHLHMNVWHHWQTANHEPWLKVKGFLKVKRLKNMNLNAFTMKKVLVHERGQIK